MRVSLLAAILGCVSLLSSTTGHADVSWEKGTRGCEPPHIFYSARHEPGSIPCCATQPGICPGGVACPPSGLCPGSNVACVPDPGPARPNVVLFISDDQGACHFGDAGECRSVESGTPLPAPITPNLDVLAAYGTVFPVAHNTAAWCYPSLNSILTGRYQRSFNGVRSKIGEAFVNIPRAMRSLGDGPGLANDPFDATANIGGYCTYFGGKFTANAGDPGFDAGVRGGARRLGRLPCDDGGPGNSARCGTEREPTGYDPSSLDGMRDVLQFIDQMLYASPDVPGQFRSQPFFIWYAPRIPHQPLDAPRPIKNYLFGSNGLTGLFDLGAMCTGGSCPPEVRAFDETNFGTVREYYSNVWWVDDNLREMRKFLDRLGTPHCRRQFGAQFAATTPAICRGTWAETFETPMSQNTAFIFLSDNGWHLPNSKHHYTENGYRTRILVFDPRTIPQIPGWRATESQPLPTPYESPALAHTTDLMPTVLGLALDAPGSQACPTSADGTACDGRDLRPFLRSAPGGPAPAENLRHAMCGHETQRGTNPSRSRYLLTRPASVGRCFAANLTPCGTDAECPVGQSCTVGRCLPTNEPACSSKSPCPVGSVCQLGRCRVAPPCLDDATCQRLLPGASASCDAKGQSWCRNAPNRACQTAGDCPACPLANGHATACGRVCEPRLLKAYFPQGTSPGPEFVDLFSDPDEETRFGRDDDALNAFSRLDGPYGPDIRNMACCVDEWWPDGARNGTFCPAGGTCPLDLSCER